AASGNPLSQIRRATVIQLNSLPDRTLAARRLRCAGRRIRLRPSSGEDMSFKTILLGAAAVAVVSSQAMARETVEQRLERMEQIIHDQTLFHGYPRHSLAA